LQQITLFVVMRNKSDLLVILHSDLLIFHGFLLSSAFS
jgi:hypothetical protein